MHFPGSSECPDFFEMPIEGDKNTRKWVFTGANGHYLIGSFDGIKFTPEVGPITADYGANYYAVQTWSDIPAKDGRRIQITWMAGGNYPQMPFNQQMSYPCELTLHETPDGLRLHRWPVKEIAALYDKAQSWRNVTVQPGTGAVHAATGDLWDIQAEFELQDAKAFGIRVRNEEVRYDVADQSVNALGRRAPLKPIHNKVVLRLLVDRTSLEVFGNHGEASLTSCFLPRLKDLGWSVYSEGGAVKVISLTAHPLHSAWKVDAR